jgi:hypothetical protein
MLLSGHGSGDEGTVRAARCHESDLHVADEITEFVEFLFRGYSFVRWHGYFLVSVAYASELACNQRASPCVEDCAAFVRVADG